ncbi:MAG: hypothetical protein ACTSW1_14610 [Candidatus Hodarchaeales archaeon]
MVSVTFEELIVILLFFVLFALFILFVYQTLRKHRQAHALTVGLILGLVGVFIMAFQPLFPTGNILKTNGSVIAIGCFYTAMYYMIYLHYEQISQKAPKLYRLTLSTALLSLGIFSTILLILLDEDPHLLTQFNDFAQDSMRFIALTFASIIAYRCWRLTREREGFIETSSLLILLSGGLPTIIANYTDFKDIGGISFYLLGDIITFIGLVCLFSVFILNPNYLYRLPFPIYYIIMFNSNGLAFYSRSVENKGIPSPEFSDQLVSASVTAISMFLREGFGSGESRLKFIDAYDRSLIFSHSYNSEITAMLMSERVTFFTWKSLNNLLNNIPPEIYKQVDSPNILEDTNTTHALDEIVHQVFPYLKFK